MTLRALKSDEEIAGVPLDQPVLIELPGGVELEGDGASLPPETKKTAAPEIDGDAKKLSEQLEALKAAQQAERERADRAEREAAEAKRAAADRAKEVEEARKRSLSLEGDIITGGLQAAQNDRDAAKAAFRSAYEAGDAAAMAEAQSRMGRAEAKILALESGAAEVAERKEAKPETRQETRTAPTFEEQVRSNPQLMSTERDWMLKNKASFSDPDFNRKLEFAYQGAIQKGVVRGSPEYFDHIERATGLKAAQSEENDDLSVQAPVSRSERTVDGRSTSSNRVTLTAEEREICRSMGISEIDYARQKVAFSVAQKNDPERYSNRG
jgi:hypothetical protein